jgi:hypothetical protein
LGNSGSHQDETEDASDRESSFHDNVLHARGIRLLDYQGPGAKLQAGKLGRARRGATGELGWPHGNFSHPAQFA